jgi:hypothetical protein
MFSFMANAEGFIAGTPVKTPTGYSEIQDIKVGDAVLSCDFQNHCVEREVTQTFHKQAEGYLTSVSDKDLMFPTPWRRFDSLWVSAFSANTSLGYTTTGQVRLSLKRNSG